MNFRKCFECLIVCQLFKFCNNQQVKYSQKMQVDEAVESYSIQITILFSVLILSLIFNIFLFYRGQGSYSVKYQILLNERFFRRHPFLSTVVEIIYKAFFALPFVLLIAIAIIRAFVDYRQFFTIMVNGLILILIIYPFKTSFFYAKLIIIWVLAISSQFISLYYADESKDKDYYRIFSFIFYPINCVLFCLSLMCKQKNYWEISHALKYKSVEKLLQEIYPFFLQGKQQLYRSQQNIQNSYKHQSRDPTPQNKKQQKVVSYPNIPVLFNGGLYGLLCSKNRRNNKGSVILYSLSLLILILNAVLIYVTVGSTLGFIGLLTNFVYDMFVFAFNILETQQRSIRNVFFLIYFGRFMSFLFGQQLWIFGYCIIYFVTGIFIGKIIVNQRFPLKNVQQKKQARQNLNFFRTPQFVFFILTVQIFLLIVASAYDVGNSNENIQYSDSVSIPLWQFALLVIIVTWIIILYLASYRKVKRFYNKIYDKVQFYFGIKSLKTYHIYILITYLIIVGLGVYCYLYLKNLTALYSSIFLPLITGCIYTLISEWINNEYQILANISDYNKKIEKKKKILQKRQIALKKQGNRHKQSTSNKFIGVSTRQLASTFGIEDKLKKSSPLKKQMTSSHDLIQEKQLQQIYETSGFPLNNDEIKTQNHTQQISQMIHQIENQEKQLQVLQDWTKFQRPPSLTQLWDCFTPSDKVIIIMIVLLSLLFVGYILCCYLLDRSIFGIFIIICLLSFLSLMPFFKHIRTYSVLQIKDYIWYQSGLVLAILYWIFYRDQLAYALIWAGLYIISLIITLAYAATKNISRQVLIWLIVNILVTVAFVILLVFFTVKLIIAILITLGIVLISFVGAIIAYIIKGGSIQTYIKIIFLFLIAGSIAALSIIAYNQKIVSNFAIFSFILLVSYVIVFALALITNYQVQKEKYLKPHVYSAYGLPIYKFDSSEQKLKSSEKHLRLFDLASILLIAYAVAVTLIFENKEYAIYALGVYECFQFIYNILFSLKTYSEIGQSKQQLTEQLYLQTLTELNEKYMIDFKDTKDRPSLKVREEKLKMKQEVDTKDLQNEDDIWLKIAILNKQQIKNDLEEDKFFFFWISLIIFHINNNIKAKKNNYLIQIKQIEQQLIEAGIYLQSINLALDFDHRYQILTIEIENLNPNDYITFQRLIKKHQQEFLQSNFRQQEQQLNIAKEEEKKQQNMKKQLQQQLKTTTDDKIKEFQNTIRSLKKKQLFKDQKFPNNQDSLGFLVSKVSKWRRPASSQEFIRGSMSPEDVRQGQIGNCYLISSLAVLGDKWLRQALGQNQDGTKRWKNQKGGYMVRFFKFSSEIYITIDDFLPVDQHQQYVFAKSQQQNEIWPCILEKAYAKLYSGYHNIVQGQCHRVLSQFTGGVPFEFLTKDYLTNPNGLWSKVISSINNKYLMGAGSPAHENGDKAFSKRNIIYGHAYSILDAKQVQGHKLIKLKNPHATGGRQWNGDFSDQSQYMTDRLIKLLGHEKKDDGVFWMKIQDFIYQFRALYMCAIFDKAIFKKFQLDGQFTSQNSFGTPSKSDNTSKNPQYGIVVTKKCTVFINLIQKDTVSTYQGKNFIFLRVQRIKGKRINKLNKNEGVCGLPMKSKNTISVSTEVILESDFYPQTFTLFTSCLEEGDTGQYKLQIYSSDKDTTIIDDKDFDLQSKQ